MVKSITAGVFMLILGLIQSRKEIRLTNNKPANLLHELMKTSEIWDVFGVNNVTKVPEYDAFLLKKKTNNAANSENQYPDKVNFHIESFKQIFRLILKKNEEPRQFNSKRSNCDYIGKVNGEKNTTLRISTCNNQLRGRINFQHTVYDIVPVPTRLWEYFPSYKMCIPHIMFKNFMAQRLKKTRMQEKCVTDECTNCSLNIENVYSQIKKEQIKLTDKRIDVAVYFDDVAYNNHKLLGFSDLKIREFILALMEQVDVIYHQPSLGIKIKINVKYIEIMHVRPVNLPTNDGNIKLLINSFISYTRNQKYKNQVDHSVLITGIYLWVASGAFRNYDVAGISARGKMCRTDSNSMVMIRFDPIPLVTSSGFFSAYFIAHEIGHSLGMLHDGTNSGNTCPHTGYLMSPILELDFEWSNCSRAYLAESLSKFSCLDTITDLDPPKMPGQKFDTDDQCRIHTENNTYTRFSPLKDICGRLDCWSNGFRDTYTLAGPALTGTTCGENKVCFNLNCISRDELNL